MTKWVRLADDGAAIDAIYLDEPEDVTGFVEVGDDVLADWRLDGLTFVPPPPPPEPVPVSITDRQFAIEARDRGFVTQAEALAFVRTGALPAALDAIIAALPQADRDDAEITLAGASTFERSHQLTAVIGDAMRGEVPLAEFLDDFFRSASGK